MSVSVYIIPSLTCIGHVTKVSCFLDLLSTHSVSKLPKFNMAFVLVSTFTIQSFITYRQRMGKLVVRMCVHDPKFDMYRSCDKSELLFGSPIHTQCL